MSGEFKTHILSSISQYLCVSVAHARALREIILRVVAVFQTRFQMLFGRNWLQISSKEINGA